MCLVLNFNIEELSSSRTEKHNMTGRLSLVLFIAALYYFFLP